MNREIQIAWFAGLFEGEGCFGIHNEKSRGISIVSTDEDVLYRIKEYFGGGICSENRNNKKENWKPAFVWYLKGQPAIDLFDEFKIHLFKRRLERGEYWKNLYLSQKEKQKIKKEILNDKKEKIYELRDLGLTHQKIAEQLGFERSTISKIINARGSV